MRLIDVDALLKYPNINWVHEFDETGTSIRYKAVPAEAIEKAPTIDAVPVVRCKDCVNHDHCICEDTFKLVRLEDGYCRVGKRREE